MKCKTYICLESIKLHVECVGRIAHSEQFVSYYEIRHIKVRFCYYKLNCKTLTDHEALARHQEITCAITFMKLAKCFSSLWN